MSQVPENLKYTKDHEWIRLEDDGSCLVGITDHAQESLGDVTFVELPAPEDSFDAETVFGVVESVKAASDLYMPVSGKILEVNESLADQPEKVNTDSYGEGWMVRVQVDDAASFEQLLGPEEYRKIL
tara:strand:- start:269 stop:649 length:381 start_codon:yes stop_codon:yes gene_type:complete